MIEELRQKLTAAGFAVTTDMLKPNILHAIPAQSVGAKWVTVVVEGDRHLTIGSDSRPHVAVEWDQATSEIRKASKSK